MATMTTPNTRLSPLPPATGRAGLRGAIASEFTKIRSVRSTYWTLAALLVVSVGIGAAITAGTAASFNHNPANKAGFDATQISLIAFFEIGQLIIAVIAALAITSEYSTGMIRTSLTAQPRRGTVYAAKAIVLTSLTLIVSMITSFIAFFVGQALLSSSGVSASLFHSVTIPQNANVNCPQGAGGGGGGGGGVPPGCKVVFSGTYVISPSTVLLAAHRRRDRDRDRRAVHHPGPRAGAAERLALGHHAVPAGRREPGGLGHHRRQRRPAPVVGLAAAWRDGALGRGPARRGRLPVPQARRVSHRRISQNCQVKPSSQPNGGLGGMGQFPAC
jgi:hypothetical protein